MERIIGAAQLVDFIGREETLRNRHHRFFAHIFDVDAHWRLCDHNDGSLVRVRHVEFDAADDRLAVR